MMASSSNIGQNQSGDAGFIKQYSTKSGSRRWRRGSGESGILTSEPRHENPTAIQKSNSGSHEMEIPFEGIFQQHTAVSCAERGLSSHLLLRGERPEIPTGYNLISEMYGNVTYIARSLYSKREEMLTTHAALVAGSSGFVLLLSDILDTSPACKSEDILWDSRRSPSSQATAEKDLRKVVIINEGVGNAKGLLGGIML
ncbi:hypothetical protein MRB53_034944 [Persea americana]|uniref:Uncharacterized protein n=1 Tax=Persea americana TaxID=3435 RepID=A0ACC2K3R7_PERAE|nr:hypothetical protein MRB53_034944 [Persea americana]